MPAKSQTVTIYVEQSLKDRLIEDANVLGISQAAYGRILMKLGRDQINNDPEAVAEHIKRETRGRKKRDSSSNIRPPNVWIKKVKKNTKNGPTIHKYYMAGWREGGKTKLFHLGSCERLCLEEAQEKACKLKMGRLSPKA